MRKSLSDRFWDKVDVREPGECWPWLGSRDPAGYGQIMVGQRPYRAHRVAKALVEGLDVTTIPRERHVLHSCDNPPCVNPLHLDFGDHTKNMAEMLERGRQANGCTAEGNKLTPEKVREIRSMAQTWDGLCDAMKKHRVSQATIADILTGRTWKHVDG